MSIPQTAQSSVGWKTRAPTGTGSRVRAARAREAEAPKRLNRSSELGAFAAQSGTEDHPPIEEVSEYLTRIMDAEPQSLGSISSAYRSSQGLLGRELERRVRIELMAVRISGAMPGRVRPRAFDGMADAGATSDGRCSSCHGFIRTPAAPVNLPGWSGPAVPGASARLDEAILWCHEPSNGGGTDRAAARSPSTMTVARERPTELGRPRGRDGP